MNKLRLVEIFQLIREKFSLDFINFLFSFIIFLRPNCAKKKRKRKQNFDKSNIVVIFLALKEYNIINNQGING